MQERLDEREDLAVHVVDSGGEEEQEADEPAGVGESGGGAGGRTRVR